MAATQPTFGMRHLTVVPTNFEPAVKESQTETENESGDTDDSDDQ